MTSHECGKELEPGFLLIAPPPPYWHHSRDAFLLVERTMKWPGVVDRVAQVRAMRCRRCRRITTGNRLECTHHGEAGYVYPQSSLRWWAGDAPFQPTLWYPLSCRS